MLQNRVQPVRLISFSAEKPISSNVQHRVSRHVEEFQSIDEVRPECGLQIWTRGWFHSKKELVNSYKDLSQPKLSVSFGHEDRF